MNQSKVLIFDSGPLINFSINGFLPLLKRLKDYWKGEFIITEEVKREVYDHPLTIKQFELGALRINELIKQGVLQFPERLGVSPQVLREATTRLTEKANSAFKAEGNFITIVSEAEMSCIALAHECKKRGRASMIAIDERTARMLSEKPENLERIMSQHLHRNVKQVAYRDEFKGVSCIRSSELVYIAYKKGLLEINDKKALEAALYATKFKGSSISWEEIEVLKRL